MKCSASKGCQHLLPLIGLVTSVGGTLSWTQGTPGAGSPSPGCPPAPPQSRPAPLAELPDSQICGCLWTKADCRELSEFRSYKLGFDKQSLAGVLTSWRELVLTVEVTVGECAAQVLPYEPVCPHTSPSPPVPWTAIALRPPRTSRQAVGAQRTCRGVSSLAHGALDQTRTRASCESETRGRVLALSLFHF